jgi:hypothetical protein
MHLSSAADRVRLALRDAGCQEWEGGRQGFVVEADPEGGWVSVAYYPGWPFARRKRERGLQNYREILLAAGFTVRDSPYVAGVIRVTAPAGPPRA